MTTENGMLRTFTKQQITTVCVAVFYLSGLPGGRVSYAARPLIVDDARIVDGKSCQVESWVKINRGNTEYWALPACNFSGNLEITSGGALTSDNDGTRTTDFVLQGKTMFRVLEPNGWSMGLTVGAVRHPDIQSSGSLIGDIYSYAPMSFSFSDDFIIVHTNLGWMHEKETGRHRMTWGIGAETQLFGERTWLITEIFGQNQGRPFCQAGLRHWVVQDRVQIDATYGNRLGNGAAEQWVSIGLRLLSLPFLP